MTLVQVLIVLGGFALFALVNLISLGAFVLAVKLVEWLEIG